MVWGEPSDLMKHFQNVQNTTFEDLNCNIDIESIIDRYGISPWGTNKLRKSDHVYYKLKERIIVGQLPANTPIGEQQVASEFKCSQGTVREAFIHLEHTGLLIKNEFKGTKVASVDAEEGKKLTKVRLELECFGVRKSASNISPKDREELCKIINAMHLASLDGRMYLCSEFDNLFHLKLFELAGYSCLAPILDRSFLHMYRFILCNKSNPFSRINLMQEHADLLDEICFGTPDEAEARMAQHAMILLNTVLAPETENAEL